MNRFVLAAALLAACPLDVAASCGSAFCVVNSDWSTQGALAEGGRLFDLRYEYIDLDQPRAGSDRVAVGSIPRHHDEVYTDNRNWVAVLDWALSPSWSVAASLPYVDREHYHLHNHHGERLPESWSFRELGDARVFARYRLSSSSTDEAACGTGITLGLKLPTGRHDVANGEGEVAERTLQPGTGTTDAVLGYYWHRAEPIRGWSYFARVQATVPMNSRDDYKPGAQVQVDGGARYAVDGKWALMLQANALWKGQDRGANAEPEDSGQRAVFVSPGISYAAGQDVQLYAFVQAPAYQWVRGVQLTADWSAVAGVSWRF